MLLRKITITILLLLAVVKTAPATDKANFTIADKGDSRANQHADLVKELFDRAAKLTAFYNDSIANGKWRGMMHDKHIGYTQWFMPEENIMPEVRYIADNSVQPYRTTIKPMTEYSIPAIKYDRKSEVSGLNWILLPDLGRAEGCMGIDNVTAHSVEFGSPSPTLEFDFEIAESDSVRIAIGILPTQDINPVRGLRLCAGIDDGSLTVIDARRGLVDTFDEYTPSNLKNSKKLNPLPQRGKMALNGYGKGMRNEVFDKIRWLDMTFPVEKPGKHTLKIHMVDPEIVLERIVINPDDSRYSYFGPPEKQ